MQSETSVIKLDANLIIPNKYQPRKVFDETTLNTLAESIKQYGIINPILVRKKDDKYEIIAGERRFRAAKKIGLTEVPVIIKNADEQQMAELALIENLERENLSSIEEAKSYEEIMRIGNQTQESLAKKLGKSQSSIANKIRLLALPIEIQEALSKRKISERHARSLLKVSDKEEQLEILDKIINEKLTVKETESLIKTESISEEDINKAIQDIMKSLQIVEESNKEPIKKEEEKEDDNMNNGNFFPNFDNNNQMTNNSSLNMMNMQSMNQAPMGAAPEMVLPTMAQPDSVPTPMTNPMPEPAPMMAPQPNPMESNLMPDFSQFGATPNTGFDMNMGINQMPEAPQPMPDFNQFGAPQMDNQQPMMPQDTPLFNPDVVMPTPMANPIAEPTPMMAPQSNPMPESVPMMNSEQTIVPVENNGFDVPVTMPTSTMDQSSDKLASLTNYLSTNGYNFKSFTGNTGNCIIIEM